MSFDDLFGDEPAVKKSVGRPKGSKTRPIETRLKDDFGNEPAPTAIGDVLNGVTIQALCAIFRMTRMTVIRRLRDCPVMGTRTGNIRLYDIGVAAKYLTEPVISLEEFVRDIKAESLPERVRETFWNAKRKEMLYRRDAGELWPTESVIEVFGETFKSIRKATQLWADTVEETVGCTNEQRNLIVNLADRLLDQVNKSLVEQASNNATYSYAAELDNDTTEI